MRDNIFLCLYLKTRRRFKKWWLRKLSIVDMRIRMLKQFIFSLLCLLKTFALVVVVIPKVFSSATAGWQQSAVHLTPVQILVSAI